MDRAARRLLGERQTEALIQRDSSLFGPAPVLVATCLPPLNTISVGIDRLPYLLATPGFSSTLSLPIFTLPFISVAISSSAGPIMRHGPHHSAQKSTTTGSSDLMTSVSKLSSVTLAVTDMASSKTACLPRSIARNQPRRRQAGRQDADRARGEDPCLDTDEVLA